MATQSLYDILILFFYFLEKVDGPAQDGVVLGCGKCHHLLEARIFVFGAISRVGNSTAQ